MSDLFRADAINIRLDDATNDLRLLRIDPAAAGLHLPVLVQLAHDVVTVAEAAGHQAARDAAPLAAPNLLRQILEEQGTHRPLEADMQLVDDAFGQRLDLDVRELQLLVDRGDIRLIARDAIERFRHDDIERPGRRIREHRCHAGPPVAGTGDGEVAVDVDDLPPFAIGTSPAVADLVLGRCFGLSV